jgi:YesN/AraC family two-component response regulator
MLKQDFDLVLADFKMPGINGIELLSKISNNSPNTARILITGYSDIDTAKEAINKAKVDNYIEKPWRNNELRTTILGALIRKSERELWNLNEVDNVREALDLVNEMQANMMNKIPIMGDKQLLILEFNSPTEFNKFSFEIRQMKNVSIDDMEIFENKYIVKIGIYLDSFEKIN